jgi:phage-related protein
MNPKGKPLVRLHGEVRSPPFSKLARLEAGFLLRRLQKGESIGMPHSRPMPGIGRNCHEPRIVDSDVTWRLVYRIDFDAIVIVEVFEKKTTKTPKHVLEISKSRLKVYDHESK